MNPAPSIVLLDWSAASMAWTEDGHQLSVPLSAMVGERAAFLAQAALADQLERLAPTPTLSWVSVSESDTGNELAGSRVDHPFPGELGICSPTLLALHPLSLRHAAESAVAYGFQVAADAQAQERPYIANWLGALNHY